MTIIILILYPSFHRVHNLHLPLLMLPLWEIYDNQGPGIQQVIANLW